VRAALVAIAAAGVLAAGCGDRTVTGTPAGSGPPAPTGGGAATSEPATSEPATSEPATTAPAPSGGSTSAAPDGSTNPGSGSSGSGSSGSGSSAGPVTRCHTADLAGSLRGGDAAAGNRYATLVLTNISHRTCTLYGYGGIQLADAGRRPVPTVQRRDPLHRPSLIRLAPGGRASALLHWGVVPGVGEPQTGRCEPLPSLLLVIPPDEHTQLAVPWRFGVVCQHGTIGQWAYQRGILTP
jgi:hypothetical protein